MEPFSRSCVLEHRAILKSFLPVFLELCIVNIIFATSLYSRPKPSFDAE